MARAARAGIRPGDVLLTIDGKDVVPPNGLLFQLGSAYHYFVIFTCTMPVDFVLSDA